MSDNYDSLTDPQIMARYNRWANARLFDVAAGLDDAVLRRDFGAFFKSIHATLNHLLVVDRLWTSRVNGEYHGLKGLDQILHEDLADLSRAREAMDDYIVRMVDRLAVGMDGGMDKEVLYRTVKDGEKHSSPARHIFLTLFNHQTHHRGQIHAMLTQAGVAEPPALDVIMFLRESAAD